MHEFSILENEPKHAKNNKVTCALSEDSDQPRYPLSQISLRCPHEEGVGPWLPIERQAKTDQTGQMPRLIYVFAGLTCHFVGFVMLQLIF